MPANAIRPEANPSTTEISVQSGSMVAEKKEKKGEKKISHPVIGHFQQVQTQG